MRTLGIALVLAAITVGLGWALGPRTPAPPLPGPLVEPDTAWLQQAAQLGEYRRWLAVVSTALTPIGLWAFVRLGWSGALRFWLETHVTRNVWLLTACYTAIVVALGGLASLPLGYLSLLLRRGYGLSPETTPDWLLRQGKELLVGLVLTLAMVEGLYWILRVAPRRWWLLGAAGAFAGMLVLTYLAPYVITPRFFTQRPLEDASLRAEIVALGERTGVPIGEIYVIDASSQGNEGNAYFTGIGGATRVVLYDTVLRQYPRSELLTILAHELGHWRRQHIWQGLLVSGIGAPLGLWLLDQALRRTLPRWGIRGPADVAGLPLIMLLATLAGIVTMPAQNWLSRRWEREADQFAIEATGEPAAFQATFVRLARQNLTDPTPPPLFEGLFATHPAVGRRVADASSSPRP